MADHEYQVLPPLSPEEYEALKTDIFLHGVLVPVVMDENGKILDGHHRVQICAEMAVHDYPTVIMPGLSEEEKLEHVYRVNLARRQVSQEWKRGEAVRLREQGRSLRWIAGVLGMSLYAIESWCSGVLTSTPEQTTGTDGKTYPAAMPTEDELTARRERAAELRDSGSTVREVAADLGVSIGTASSLVRPVQVMTPNARKRAKAMRQIHDIQETDPDALVGFGSGDASAVNILHSKVHRENKLLRPGASDWPEGKYQVVYADPPWSYNNTGFENSAAQQYPTMPTEDICALDVPGLLLDDAVLFLWATNPLLSDAMQVLSAWGFNYKTNFVWVKANGFTRGFYNLGQHELLLVATKGHCRPVDTGLRPSVLNFPKGQHSRKPDEVYAMIEAMYPGSYVELFARRPRANWSAWGNEAVEGERVPF